MDELWLFGLFFQGKRLIGVGKAGEWVNFMFRVLQAFLDSLRQSVTVAVKRTEDETGSFKTTCFGTK